MPPIVNPYKDRFTPIPLGVFRNGLFSVEYTNGDRYEGDFADGFRHGEGTYFFAKPAGTRYEGQFRKDKFCGRGVYHYEVDKYEGEWKDDLKHGHGTYTYKKEGSIYDGQWQNDLRHGVGTFTDKTGTYVGAFANDLKNGQCVAEYSDGSKYEGQYADNKRNGNGKMNYANGNQYVGEWLNNLPHGHGELYIAGVGMYTGEFRNGKQHGEGVQMYDGGDFEKFEGQFHFGMKLSGIRYPREGNTEKTLYQMDVLIQRVEILPEIVENAEEPKGEGHEAGGEAGEPAEGEDGERGEEDGEDGEGAGGKEEEGGDVE